MSFVSFVRICWASKCTLGRKALIKQPYIAARDAAADSPSMHLAAGVADSRVSKVKVPHNY
jgi:hypothetical protein